MPIPGQCNALGINSLYKFIHVQVFIVTLINYELIFNNNLNFIKYNYSQSTNHGARFPMTPRTNPRSDCSLHYNAPFAWFLFDIFHGDCPFILKLCKYSEL